MAKNFNDHFATNILPFNSSDLNKLDYYMRDVVERDINKYARDTKDSLKAGIIRKDIRNEPGPLDISKKVI